ncbi:MAG: hypothetical protein JWO31_631, partial [Phycisphaerales bacterium]|nr:hypothetical protein [Phycisphaerales bacterium]
MQTRRTRALVTFAVAAAWLRVAGAAPTAPAAPTAAPATSPATAPTTATSRVAPATGPTPRAVTAAADQLAALPRGDLPPAVAAAVEANDLAKVVAACDAERARAQASPDEWELDYSAAPVELVVIGKQHGYLGSFEDPTQPPGPSRAWVPIARKDLPIGRDATGRLRIVTCVDLATGRRLWSRALLPYSRLAVDPRDDALWAWREKQSARAVTKYAAAD